MKRPRARTGLALAGAFLAFAGAASPFAGRVVLASGQVMAPVLVDALPAEGPLVVRVLPSLVETVTVTTGAAPRIEAAPASALTTVGREDMEQRHTLRLADLLENIPGAGRLEEGHSVVPSLRGLARARDFDDYRPLRPGRAGPES